MLKKTSFFVELICAQINKLASFLTIVCMGSLSLIIFISVISRYIWNTPIIFANELSKLLFVWSCTFALTITFYKKDHIKFDFISYIIGKERAKKLDLFNYIGSILFFLILFWSSLVFIERIWFIVFSTMNFSQGWLYVPLPIISAIGILYSIMFVLQIFIKKE